MRKKNIGKFVFWGFLIVTTMAGFEALLVKKHVDPLSNYFFGFFSIFTAAVSASLLMGGLYGSSVEEQSNMLAMEKSLNGLKLPVGEETVVTICCDVKVFNGEIVGYAPRVGKYYTTKKGNYIFGDGPPLFLGYKKVEPDY